MARKHETKVTEQDDGSKHVTKHSYSGSDSGQPPPKVHRSHDVSNDGEKSGDHMKDHSTGHNFHIQEGDGNPAGSKTDSKGNTVKDSDS